MWNINFPYGSHYFSFKCIYIPEQKSKWTSIRISSRKSKKNRDDHTDHIQLKAITLKLYSERRDSMSLDEPNGIESDAVRNATRGQLGVGCRGVSAGDIQRPPLALALNFPGDIPTLWWQRDRPTHLSHWSQCHPILSPFAYILTYFSRFI